LAGPVVAKSFPPYDIIALVALIIGIGLYQLQSETMKSDVKKNDPAVPIEPVAV
jgi:hypothetical protein